jgi:hypothetical protein
MRKSPFDELMSDIPPNLTWKKFYILDRELYFVIFTDRIMSDFFSPIQHQMMVSIISWKACVYCAVRAESLTIILDLQLIEAFLKRNWWFINGCDKMIAMKDTPEKRNGRTESLSQSKFCPR